MPNPASVPIIGSGFDSVAGQIRNWAGFNQGVEEGNFARAAQADQQKNNYFAQIAEQARRDAEADHNDALQQQQVARQDAGEKRRQYEFGVNRGDRVAAEATDAALKREQLGMKREEYTRSLAAADNSGNFMAPDVSSAGDAYDKARDTFNDAQRKFDTVRSTEEAKVPPGTVFNPKLKQFVNMTAAFEKDETKKANVAASVAAANARIELAKADLDAATELYSHHENAFTTLRQQANQSGLQIGKKNGKYVLLNPFTGKTYQAPEVPVENKFVPVMGKLDDKLRGYNFSPAPTSTSTTQPQPAIQPAPSGPVSISTQAQYDALPSGASYVNARTGRLATKP